jgi:hypothetical protein
MSKSLLELRGKEFIAILKAGGYETWWDYHPCKYCKEGFVFHVEDNWICRIVNVSGWYNRYEPMDNLSYVEWLNEQNNRRIS